MIPDIICFTLFGAAYAASNKGITFYTLTGISTKIVKVKYFART